MFRTTQRHNGAYLLFRYLESDWRQPVLRQENSHQCKQIFNSITNGTNNSAEYESAEWSRKFLFAFSKNGMTDEVNSVLRHVRSTTNLESFHFNFLFRCLAAAREQQACSNLLKLMVEKEEVDTETASIAVCALHTWSGRNRLSSILTLLRRIHCPPPADGEKELRDNFPMLPLSQPWRVRTAWELSMWPTPKRLSLPHTLADDEARRTAKEVETGLRTSHREAPTLSALLYALVNGPEGTLAALVVVAWIKASGAELSAYDYFHLLSVLARDACRDVFREVFWIFCEDPCESNVPEGCVVLSRIAERLKKCSLSTSFSTSSSRRDVLLAQSVVNLAIDSLRETDPNAIVNPVYVGFFNKSSSSSSVSSSFSTTTTRMSADTIIEHVFNEIYRRPTVGFAGESPINIHHAFSLLLVGLRRDSVACQELDHALRRIDRWNKKFASCFQKQEKKEQEQRKKKTEAKVVAVVEKKPRKRLRERKRGLLGAAQDEAAQNLKDAAQQRKSDKNTASSSSSSSLTLDESATNLAVRDEVEVEGGTPGYFSRAAPSLLPGEDSQRLLLSLWFPKDVGFRFPFIPRFFADKTRTAYDEICNRARYFSSLPLHNSSSNSSSSSFSKAITDAAAKESLGEAQEVDVWTCWSLGLPLLHKHNDIADALETVLSALKRRDSDKSVRQMVRSLLYLFAVNPPSRIDPNKKEHFAAERRKWGKYFEARDAALSLFGTTKAGREAMRTIYGSDGRLVAMRSNEVIESDISDVCNIFASSASSSSPSQELIPKPERDLYLQHFKQQPQQQQQPGEELLEQQQQQQERDDKFYRKIRISSTSLFGGLSDIPHHVSQISETCEYPRKHHHHQNNLNKKKNSNNNNNNNKGEEENQEQQEEEQEEEDLFMKFHRVASREEDQWWFTEAETSGNYLRCLLHRYDWKTASDVAATIVVKQGFQAALDAEILRMFEEMGDPGGAQCFKFATKFVDGRIIDGGGTNPPSRIGMMHGGGDDENHVGRQTRRRPLIFGSDDS